MKHTHIQAIQAVAICTAVALGFSAAAAPAATSGIRFESDGVLKYVVRFSDLDLGKIDGAAALYRRVSQAAAIVCDPLRRESLDFVISAKYRACVAQAIAGAVAGVNQPLLSQYHQSRTNGAKIASMQLVKAD